MAAVSWSYSRKNRRWETYPGIHFLYLHRGSEPLFSAGHPFLLLGELGFLAENGVHRVRNLQTRLHGQAVPERWLGLGIPERFHPEFSAKGFADLQEAREWASSFVHWYNHNHRHSGIRYVSPSQRHAGEDRDILAARHGVYVQAKAAHPRRWARHTRNWNPITVVTLNPERDCVITASENAARKSRAAP
jgi:hypothetical protein